MKKLAPLMALALLSACTPEDKKLESPLIKRKTPLTQQREFERLFGSTEASLYLELPLMVADQNLEAAKMLEFSLNLTSEVQRLQTELERQARGERANQSITCRDIQLLTDTADFKRVMVTYNCNGRTGLYRTEVRGQELYTLTYAEGQLRALSMETFTDFESRVLRFASQEVNQTMSGSNANIKETRRLEASLAEGTTYRFAYTGLLKYDQRYRKAPRNYKDGYTELGELKSQVQGQVTFRRSGPAEMPRFTASTMRPMGGIKGAMGSITVKGERASIDESMLKFKNNFILTANLTAGDEIAMDYNHCGELRQDFAAETRWLSGRFHGEKQYRGQLSMQDKAIVFRQGVTDRTPEGTGKPDLSWQRCYGRSPILPLIPRNKFFIR